MGVRTNNIIFTFGSLKTVFRVLTTVSAYYHELPVEAQIRSHSYFSQATSKYVLKFNDQLWFVSSCEHLGVIDMHRLLCSIYPMTTTSRAHDG